MMASTVGLAWWMVHTLQLFQRRLSDSSAAFQQLFFSFFLSPPPPRVKLKPSEVGGVGGRVPVWGDGDELSAWTDLVGGDVSDRDQLFCMSVNVYLRCCLDCGLLHVCWTLTSFIPSLFIWMLFSEGGRAILGIGYISLFYSNEQRKALG